MVYLIISDKAISVHIVFYRDVDHDTLVRYDIWFLFRNIFFTNQLFLYILNTFLPWFHFFICVCRCINFDFQVLLIWL